MTRNINDFLVSGEASNIVVNGNIGYISVSGQLYIHNANNTIRVSQG